MNPLIDANMIQFCWGHCFETKQNKVFRLLQEAFELAQEDQDLIIYGIDFVDEKIYCGERQHTIEETISFFDYFAINNLVENESSIEIDDDDELFMGL